MVTTVGTFILAILLTELMHLKGASTNIVKGLNILGARSAAIATPIIIGLLPMPGGAYASAMITNPLYETLRLRPEERTYVNYWFRHIFSITWPLVPGVVIVAGILGLEPYIVSAYTWPISLASLTAGLILTTRLLKESIPLEKDIRGILHLWPLLTILSIAFITGISMFYALLITSILYVLVTHVRFKEFTHALRHALNPTILIVVIVALIFSKYLQFSNVGVEFFNLLKGWETIFSFAISFIIGIAIGIESVSMALSISILASFIPSENLIYGFLGLYIGHLLSPCHPCLIMTVEYYKSEYLKVYKYLLFSVAVTIFLALFIITTIYAYF
jgi:integral membrane protein (TIGR00529 family)